MIDGNSGLNLLTYSMFCLSVQTWIVTYFSCNTYSLLSVPERQTLSYEPNDHVKLFHIIHNQLKRVIFITIKNIQKRVTKSLRSGVRDKVLLYNFIHNWSIDSLRVLLFTCYLRCNCLCKGSFDIKVFQLLGIRQLLVLVLLYRMHQSVVLCKYISAKFITKHQVILSRTFGFKDNSIHFAWLASEGYTETTY